MYIIKLNIVVKTGTFSLSEMILFYKNVKLK